MEQPTKRPLQPKPSVLASKYPCLKEIEDRLKDQNKAIIRREKKRDASKTAKAKGVKFGRPESTFRQKMKKTLEMNK